MRFAIFTLLVTLLSQPLAAEQMTFGNATRTYELFRPARQVAARNGMPLLVVLHETGGTAVRIRRSLGMDALAQREGFAVAYAQALNGNWNDGRHGLGPQRQGSQREQPGADDVGFIRALVTELAGRGVGSLGDAAVVGVDGGGMMVYRLACESTGVFSSYAALLANMPIELRQKCQPAARKPMLILAGTSDAMMPFGGGKLATTSGIVQSADATYQFWGQVNGCGAGEVVTLPDADQSDGTRIEMIAAENCAQNADTVFYRVVGGGHQLPTRPASSRPIDRSGGQMSHDIDTAELIWLFAAGRR